MSYLTAIELSNCGEVPSPGRENPSGLFNGESLTVQPISDLDLFFERLYSYYIDKGLWCIIVKWAVELLSLGFIMCLWYYNSGISVVLRMQNVEWMLLNLGLSHAILSKRLSMSILCPLSRSQWLSSLDIWLSSLSTGSSAS